MKQISNLHYITTNAHHAGHACKGGVDWIQLRLKNVSYDEYKAIAMEVQAVCKKYNATFIINDNIQLALEINADGVHVGKEDPLPQHHIDAMLAKGGIIGCTANTIEDFIHLSGKPVSYIGLGPYQFTTTKQHLSPILGINGYKKIFSELHFRNITYAPIIGIGGITAEDVSVLMSTGLHGIAVSGAITGSPDITNASRNFKDLLDPSNKQVYKTTTINAPVSDVWRTITNPAMIKNWFSDTPVEVLSDWKEGSSIIFKGNWQNKPYEDKGTLLKYKPEQMLRYSYWSYWNKFSNLQDIPENYSIVEFRLTPLGEQTELTLTQNNFKLDTIYRHSNFYWTLAIDRLKKTIENT